MNVVAVILGGGEGKRLQPLTRDRCKPAVPLAGKYRLVDIPVSNCINSGFRRIYVLTQFNSVSLHQHVQGTYVFDQFHSGFVRILAAQQTPSSESWFQGTADAVRQGIRYIMDREPDYILILSGDQLYQMDFRPVMEAHIRNKAEVTICTKPVPRAEAGALGIMQADEKDRIVRFVEKPGDTPLLDELREPGNGPERYLASMGIYVFNTRVLLELLANEEKDFGKNIIPAAIKDRAVYRYLFEGYWRDIGTIRAFWEANMELAEMVPQFNLYDVSAPVYTHMRYLPPSKINACDLNRALLSEGCIITGHRILRSIIGVRAKVGTGSVLEHTVLMGADWYDPEPLPPGQIPMGVGRDCFIRNAIIDKNACIGDGCYITPDGKDNVVTDQYTVQDGVIVIPKKAVIPAGTHI
ncbi:MAG TPA: glucose-1-phosphate adenylyltransferase [Kiritimatiellia bacterium]|jgi:glucose-1-phosphate adenylyltransferase|nr:glucose-1-phosphate adenylyltransferase [Kiritimatiellia bacterium]HQG74172.1 glucose-1-phosphate adenylyltransferase [Kiritimatiellia bacterium]